MSDMEEKQKHHVVAVIRTTPCKHCKSYPPLSYPHWLTMSLRSNCHVTLKFFLFILCLLSQPLLGSIPIVASFMTLYQQYLSQTSCLWISLFYGFSILATIVSQHSRCGHLNPRLPWHVYPKTNLPHVA
jgi:hypothetical protein